MITEDLLRRNRGVSPVRRGIANALTVMGGGQPTPYEDDDKDLIDRMVKMQQLQTGSPEFQLKLAQQKATIGLSNKIAEEQAIEEYNRIKNQRILDGLMGPDAQGQPVTPMAPMTPVPNTVVPDSPARSAELMPSTTGKVPAFVRLPSKPAELDIDASAKYGRRIMKPSSYDWKPNPDYVTPEQQAKQDEADRIRKAQDDLLRDKAQTMLGNIREAKKGATRPGTKFFGKLGGEKPTGPINTPNTFWGEAGDDRIKWEQNINQLLANQVLEVMNEMRAASKSGSTGFGALSEKELETLRQAASALNRRLAPDDALNLLRDMERVYLKVLRKPLKSLYAEKNSGANQPPRGNELSAIDAELAQIDAALGI